MLGAADAFPSASDASRKGDSAYGHTSVCSEGVWL
jgi:hypothetical protein